MSKKETILRLIDLIEQAELELANSLSAIERQNPGTLENWAPKEVLCHTVDWTERMLDNIEHARKGEAITEYENYLEARKTLPKKNKRVITPNGEGKVVDVFPLRGAVLVEIPEIGKKEFDKDEIRAADEQEVINKPALYITSSSARCSRLIPRT